VPEGPELAVSRDMLIPILVDKNILEISAGGGRYSKNPPAGFLEFNDQLMKSSGKIVEVATKGKFMWWKITFPHDTEPWFLWCTYGMSGQWNPSSTKHTCFSVTTEDVQLFFNDQRHFGTIKFVRGDTEHQKKLNTLGPCILSGGVTPEIFAKRLLKKPSATIAEALMYQGGVSGVGNYIKAECLHRARISPWRKVSDITSGEYVNLCEATLNVARESYQSQGASIYTYTNPDEHKGSMQFNFSVYSQSTCPKGHDIRNEETPEGRTSWWCPVCQR